MKLLMSIGILMPSLALLAWRAPLKQLTPSTMAFVFGHYARIQVEIDLMQTLPPRLLVEREGYSFKVPVSYESLPNGG